MPPDLPRDNRLCRRSSVLPTPVRRCLLVTIARKADSDAPTDQTGCLSTIALLMLIAIVATGILWFQGQKTPAGRPDYVVLGSSYAAGAGLGSLQSGSPLACALSVNGYP